MIAHGDRSSILEAARRNELSKTLATASYCVLSLVILTGACCWAIFGDSDTPSEKKREKEEIRQAERLQRQLEMYIPDRSPVEGLY